LKRRVLPLRRGRLTILCGVFNDEGSQLFLCFQVNGVRLFLRDVASLLVGDFDFENFLCHWRQDRYLIFFVARFLYDSRRVKFGSRYDLQVFRLIHFI
jgi:hypothetical protein